jgi:hypothetical protein
MSFKNRYRNRVMVMRNKSDRVITSVSEIRKEVPIVGIGIQLLLVWQGSTFIDETQFSVTVVSLVLSTMVQRLALSEEEG